MNFAHVLGRVFILGCMLFLSIGLAAQGITTASINGRITDVTGEPLIGANVLAVHLPSGTVYGNSTDLDGYYRIPGMRVGGPYKVTISYTGYEEYVTENVYLDLDKLIDSTHRFRRLLSSFRVWK